MTGYPFVLINPAGTTREDLFFLANPGLFSSTTTLSMNTFLQGCV